MKITNREKILIAATIFVIISIIGPKGCQWDKTLFKYQYPNVYKEIQQLKGDNHE